MKTLPSQQTRVARVAIEDAISEETSRLARYAIGAITPNLQELVAQ